MVHHHRLSSLLRPSGSDGIERREDTPPRRIPSDVCGSPGGTVSPRYETPQASELEGVSQARGAVPYRWGLGGGPGVCVLLDVRGAQAGRSLTCETAAESVSPVP